MKNRSYIKSKLIATILTLGGISYYLAVGNYLLKHITGMPYLGY